MSIALIFGLSVCLLGYVLTFFIGKSLILKNDVSEEYRFSKDPYIYIFGVLLVSFFGVGLLLPDFKDLILPLNRTWLGCSFLFAALIYVLYLLETDKLLDFCVMLFCVLSAFWFVDKNVAADFAPVPSFLVILGMGLVMGLVTLGARVFIGLPGVFSVVMSMISLGLILISCAGGVPLYLGIMAASMLGVFVSVFQFNRWERNLKINEGAMMSSMFLFCMLLMQGANELAAPSMFILTIYVVVELLWSLFFEYFLRRKESDLFFNTVYFKAFEKGVSVGSVQIVIFKLCVVNIVLALFQLYAQNAFTLPCLGVIINFWLLSKVFNIDNETRSLAEINKDFIENVKNEIVEIKQNFKKD